MFLTLVKYFPSKKACDVCLQLHNHVRATDEITPHLMSETHSPGKGNEWVAPLLHILQGEVDRSMRTPPFVAIFLLRPRYLDALQHHQHALLASSIQVLSSGISVTVMIYKSLFRWLGPTQVDIPSQPPRFSIFSQKYKVCLSGLLQFLEAGSTTRIQDPKHCLLRSLLLSIGTSQLLLMQCCHFHQVS